MDLYVGLVDKETKLRVILRHTAMPSLIHSEAITRTGFPPNELDWGILASEHSKHKMAELLLNDLMAPYGSNAELRSKFVKDIVSSLASDCMWMITKSDLRLWLAKHVEPIVQ